MRVRSVALAFRQRLLVHVGGRVPLAWNIVLVFVVLQAGWGWKQEISLIVYELLSLDIQDGRRVSARIALSDPRGRAVELVWRSAGPHAGSRSSVPP